MKGLISTSLIALITLTILHSCKKPPAVTPGSVSKTTTTPTTTTQTTTTEAIPILPTIPHGTIIPGATITGRWNLVHDSTYSVFQTVGPATVTIRNSVGAAGDYYDFEASGKLSIRHGSFSTDTAGYTLTTDNKVYIVYTPHACMTGCTMYGNVGEGKFAITTLTPNELVLCSLVYTPEGPMEEIMTFKK